ncbi:hypothetical protein GJ496_009745 [Pomphorhynchus laevis]|nr:hypothetical protein GJ496_009745 [Pomphorhynchus laevis]
MQIFDIPHIEHYTRATALDIGTTAGSETFKSYIAKFQIKKKKQTTNQARRKPQVSSRTQAAPAIVEDEKPIPYKLPAKDKLEKVKALNNVQHLLHIVTTDFAEKEKGVLSRQNATYSAFNRLIHNPMDSDKLQSVKDIVKISDFDTSRAFLKNAEQLASTLVKSKTKKKSKNKLKNK